MGLRDYAGIVAYLSDEEIDALQAAADARREAKGGTQPTSTGPSPYGGWASKSSATSTKMTTTST